jgi:hypothetical protein
MSGCAMNHLDNLVHDWGWWNRAYSRLLIRSRGYRLVSMLKALPPVETVSELAQHENGALLRLEPRQSLHDLKPPKVALGEHAAYVVDYYKREFTPREDRPFIAYFRNPVLYGRQFSILDSRRHAFAECFTRDRRWREGVPKQQKQATPKKVPGTYLLAGAEFHNHYAHLFCDVLPRFKIFEDAGLAGCHPNILPPKSHAFADEAIRLLGLEENGSIRWDDGCWQLDGLYFASSFKKFCSWTPESVAWVRAKLAPELIRRPVGKKIVYISRSDGPRSVLNEEEIIARLQSYDVTVVQTEKLTLQQQIDLFSEAGLIVGPHGAGIQNALWAPRGCRVLELVNARYFSGIYWTLAESLNQPYGLVTGISAAGKDPLQEGYTCDPRLVQQAIDRLGTAT